MTRHWLALALIASIAGLQGCATPPAPEALPGPTVTTAVITDTATGGGRSGGALFSVITIDGTQVPNNLEASRKNSYGRGLDLRLVSVQRSVPAGKVKLELSGQVAYGAPIQEIFASVRDRLHAVTGTIEVELKPLTSYRVNGVLDELRTEVWIEEEGSRQIIGRKISGPPSAEYQKAAAAESAFTCCNFRYTPDEAWISDANWATLPFVPAGTPIKVYEYGRNRAKVMLDGAPMWLGLDYGREQESIQQWVAKVTLKDDPTLRLAGYPVSIQAAVRAGKVMPGMSKEQVIMSLGYPRTDTTRSLELAKWSYRTFDDKEYLVLWGADGRVKDVDADAKIKRLVLVAE